MSNYSKSGFLFSQYLGNCIQGHKIVCMDCSKLRVFVLSNSLMNWSNKNEVKEQFDDRTYNNFKKVKSPYNSQFEDWWEQEYLKELLEIYVEEKPLGDCPICLDEITIPVKTICGHIFCKSCLDKTNKDRYSNLFAKCPLCRTSNTSNRPFYKEMILKSNELSFTCYNILRNKNMIQSCGNCFKGSLRKDCYKCWWEKVAIKEEHNIIQFQITFGAMPQKKDDGWVIIDCDGEEHKSFDDFMENGATYDEMGSYHTHYDSDDEESNTTILSYPNIETDEELVAFMEGGLDLEDITETLIITDED